MIVHREKRSHSRRLSLEPLEDRQLLASVQVSDINPGGNASVNDLTVLDDLVFFTAGDSGGEFNLYETDGSSSSIRDVSPEGSFSGFVRAVGETVVFTNESQIWATDGTTSRPILDIPSFFDFTTWNDEVVTFAENEVIFTPIDGSPATTVSMQDSGLPISFYGNSADDFYVIYGNGDNSFVAWASDGTQDGTQVIATIAGPIGTPFLAGESLGFTTQTSSDDDGWTGEFWLVDRTSSQVVTRLEGTGSFPTYLDVPFLPATQTFEDESFFYTGDELWQTDGTPEGTRLFSDEFVWPVWSEGDVTWFLTGESPEADFFEHDRLWRTDGSADEAVFLADGVRTEELFEHDGEFFFAVESGVIWSSDGTPDGTKPLENFTGAYEGNSLLLAPQMAVLRNSLFFAGTSDENSSLELHRYTLEPQWNNPFDSGDVNDDGIVTPLDVLLIINELNDRQFIDETGLINADPVAELQMDVNNDGFISPIDALSVISELDLTPPQPITSPQIDADLSDGPLTQYVAELTADEDEDDVENPYANLADIAFGEDN